MYLEYSILILLLIMLVSMAAIFRKAQKPAWASLIPFYNVLVLLEIIEKPWWWMVLLLLPGVNVVVLIWMKNLLSKAFERSTGFTLGLILLPFVFYPVLAFGRARYRRGEG